MISISDKRRIFGPDIDSIDNNSRAVHRAVEMLIAAVRSA
jgi:hypothetical protein